MTGPRSRPVPEFEWTVHGERYIYESEWVALSLVDVEPQGAERFNHHVIRSPAPAAGVVVHDLRRGVLMIWRHRFITDTWGWEIPAGRVDQGETNAGAAAREVLEETGWRPGPLTPLISFHPTNGSSDQTFHIFVAAGAEHVGDPTDVTEAAEVAWVPTDQVRAMLVSGQILDGLSLAALGTAFVANKLT